MKRNRCPNTNGKLLLMGVLCSLLIISMAASASALIRTMSLEEIVQRADLIIVGVVEDVKSYWVEEETFAYSQATIKVNEVINDAANFQTVIVEYPGGIYDGMGYGTSDDIPLNKGDNVLLFLESKKSKIFEGNAFYIIGSHRGTFKVDKDGVALGGGYTIENGERKSFIDLPLDDLIEKIKSAL